MELDATRGPRRLRTLEERRRRSDASLCAYCRQPDHLIATFPFVGRRMQSRVISHPPLALRSPPAGYPYPLAGYPFPPTGYHLVPPYHDP